MYLFSSFKKNKTLINHHPQHHWCEYVKICWNMKIIKTKCNKKKEGFKPPDLRDSLIVEFSTFSQCCKSFFFLCFYLLNINFNFILKEFYLSNFSMSINLWVCWWCFMFQFTIIIQRQACVFNFWYIMLWIQCWLGSTSNKNKT